MWLYFDEGRDGGLIICGEDRFFIAESADGRRFVVSTRCRHRGGPLHMGRKDGGKACIRCPWHELDTPIKALERRSVPSIRIGSKWIARLPDDVSPERVVVMPLPGSAV